MELNAAARLRAYTFPSGEDLNENLLDLLTVLKIQHTSLTPVTFGSIKAPAVIAHLSLDDLKAKLLHTLEQAKDETFALPVSEEGQQLHCISGKFVEEFPKAGRMSGLMAVLLAPKENGHTLVCVCSWAAFLKYKRLG